MRMDLTQTSTYRSLGLNGEELTALQRFLDMLLSCRVNVSAIRDPVEIEKKHFLDALSLTNLPFLDRAHGRFVDVGCGNGVPGLVLAIARPELRITLLESVKKKCEFLQSAVEALGLRNARVERLRAEDFGRGAGRSGFDVAVTRAVGSLPVVAELSVPLLEVGGFFVAMKAAMSDQEWICGERALAILGVPRVEVVQARPFEEATDRYLVYGRKTMETPAAYPRRAGIPAKRPLGDG